MAQTVETLTVQLEASIVKYEKAMNKALGVTNKNTRAIETRMTSLQQNVDRVFSLVGRGAAALGLGLSVREVISYSDAWTRATNSLKVAGLQGADLAGVMNQLFEIAQRQGVPIESLTTLYGRAAQSAGELGASQQELVQFSEDVATALRVAGTSPEEATGALLQLSQALGSSRVQAEEFNSINEGARPILQAVANGIEEAGGSVSKLKQLVNDGEISNVAFFKGFQAGAEGLRQQAAGATDTIAQGFTRVTNAITKTIGQLGETTGASRNAAENLKSVASAIEQIPSIVNSAVSAYGDLNRALNDLGNNPFWRRVGAALGVQYSAAEAAARGITVVNPTDPVEAGRAALRAGRGTALGDGFQLSDLSKGTNTIRAKDFPVANAKDSAKTSRERVNQFDREVEALNRRAAAMRLDVDVMGRSTYEAERARATQELLSAARQQYGENISPAVRERIDMEADSYARVAAATEQAARQQQDWNALQQEMGGFLTDNIASVVAGYQSWNDVLKNGLGLITQMVLQAALLGQGPLGSMFGLGASGGGAGGLVGALFSGFKGLFADGGTLGAGQWGIAGEAGPEIVTGPARIVPTAALAAATPVARAGRMSSVYAPQFTIDARGSQMTEAQFRTIAAQVTVAGLSDYDRRLAGRIAEINQRGA